MKLREVKEFLEKRQNQVRGIRALYESYENVINDLIDSTDPCTGELYL